MRNVLRIFILIYVLGLSGCASFGTEAAWQKAEQTNTVESYQDFLKKYPAGSQEAEAKKRIAQLEWEKAAALNTRNAYIEYIQSHPNDTHTTEARNRLENLDWDLAVKTRTIRAYEQYLSQYPNGAYRAKALLALEKNYWLKAERTNSVAAYQEFLKEYPNSKYAYEARVNLEKLAWKQAKAKRTPEAIKTFLKQYPKSSMAKTAQNELQHLEWLLAKQNGAPAAYQKFFAAYPEGPYSHDALILGSIISIELSLKDHSAQPAATSPFARSTSTPSSTTISPGHKSYLVAQFTINSLQKMSLSIKQIHLIDSEGKSIPAQIPSDSTWLVQGDKAKQMARTTFAPGKTSDFTCIFAVEADKLKGSRIILDDVEIPLQEKMLKP